MSRPKLSGQRLEALDLLARGESSEDTGKAVGVSGRTIRRWAAEPAFAEALAELGSDALEGARGVLRASAAELAEVLVAVAFDAHAAPAARVRAVEAALDRIGLVPGQRVQIDSAGDETALVLDGRIILGGKSYVAVDEDDGDEEETP